MVGQGKKINILTYTLCLASTLSSVSAMAETAFTKLDGQGKPLPMFASTWDCVKDNKTGLVWEEKTSDHGLRDKDWTYTWYDTNASNNGGELGYQDRHHVVSEIGQASTCGQTLAQCNTALYVQTVNQQGGICGFSDWQLPTKAQLTTLLSPANATATEQTQRINTQYFSLLPSNTWYWSSTTSQQDHKYAWLFYFDYGKADDHLKFQNFAVRLVRGTP